MNVNRVEFTFAMDITDSALERMRAQQDRGEFTTYQAMNLTVAYGGILINVTDNNPKD